MAQVPNHNDWKKLKTKHGIGSNMVSSVNVGKALDAYHNNLSGHKFKENAALAETLAAELTTYKSKFPDKKGEKKAFLTEFDKLYVKAAMTNVEEFKSMAGVKEGFAERVLMLLSAAGKVKAGDSFDLLQQMRQGPIRGMLAAAKTVKGYDSQPLTDIWKPVEEMIEKHINVNAVQGTVDAAIKIIQQSAVKTSAHCKKTGLF